MSVPVVPTAAIGTNIDKLHNLREKRRQLEAQIEDLNAEYQKTEREVLEDMSTHGLEKASGKFANVAVQETVKPNVENWDDFYGFIARNKYFHLLERRPSVTGCRELFETKGKIPGVLPVTLKRLSLRNT